ncbi:DciA family protein [Streptomyces sp. NPDC054854]
MAERGWDIPTAGAGLCERWAALVPDLADHVAAVGYDAERGELTLRPESTAWATKARLEQARVIEAANSAAGHTVVRTLRILPPGAVPALAPDDVTLASRAVATGPAKTREGARATAVPSPRTARPRRLARPTRPSRRQWSGRPGYYASSAAGRSPTRSRTQTAGWPRSRTPVPSVVAKPWPPRLPPCAGLGRKRPALPCPFRHHAERWNRLADGDPSVPGCGHRPDDRIN